MPWLRLLLGKRLFDSERFLRRANPTYLLKAQYPFLGSICKGRLPRCYHPPQLLQCQNELNNSYKWGGKHCGCQGSDIVTIRDRAAPQSAAAPQNLGLQLLPPALTMSVRFRVLASMLPKQLWIRRASHFPRKRMAMWRWYLFHRQGWSFFATAGDRPSRQWMTCSPNFWHLINCRVSFPSLLALLSVVLFCHVCLHQRRCFSYFHTAYVGNAYMIMPKESSTKLVKIIVGSSVFGERV